MSDVEAPTLERVVATLLAQLNSTAPGTTERMGVAATIISRLDDGDRFAWWTKTFAKDGTPAEGDLDDCASIGREALLRHLLQTEQITFDVSALGVLHAHVHRRVMDATVRGRGSIGLGEGSAMMLKRRETFARSFYALQSSLGREPSDAEVVAAAPDITGFPADSPKLPRLDEAALYRGGLFDSFDVQENGVKHRLPTETSAEDVAFGAIGMRSLAQDIVRLAVDGFPKLCGLAGYATELARQRGSGLADNPEKVAAFTGISYRAAVEYHQQLTEDKILNRLASNVDADGRGATALIEACVAADNEKTGFLVFVKVWLALTADAGEQSPSSQVADVMETMLGAQVSRRSLARYRDAMESTLEQFRKAHIVGAG